MEVKKMKNKKVIIIIFIILIVIVACVFGLKAVFSTFMFNQNNSIVDGKEQLFNKIRNFEDSEERKKQLDLLLENGMITQEEANSLY